MLPESHMIDQGITISLYHIKYRIQLQDLCKDPCKTKVAEIPHNGSYPYPYLKPDVDDLTEIPEKYHHRAGKISHCQNQHKNTEAVINKLKGIPGRRIAHAGIDHQNDQHKKAVDKPG